MIKPTELAELWTLSHAGDAVRCIAAQHPRGIELRYVMNEHPLISRVFQDWEELTGQAQLWWEGLVSRGWTEIAPTRH